MVNKCDLFSIFFIQMNLKIYCVSTCYKKEVEKSKMFKKTTMRKVHKQW